MAQIQISRCNVTKKLLGAKMTHLSNVGRKWSFSRIKIEGRKQCRNVYNSILIPWLGKQTKNIPTCSLKVIPPQFYFAYPLQEHQPANLDSLMHVLHCLSDAAEDAWFQLQLLWFLPNLQNINDLATYRTIWKLKNNNNNDNKLSLSSESQLKETNDGIQKQKYQLSR